MDNVLYKGFLTLVKRTFNGRDWEVVKLKPAVAALIMNESRDKILLVKQNRAAIMKEIWEIPAGMMDVDGESLCSCMVRELEEEADIILNPNELNKMVGYYPNIGTTDHYLEIYQGVVSQTYESKIISDADVTEARWFTITEIREMIMKGEIVDGKTILAFSMEFKNQDLMSIWGMKL
jgi:8-oxo-dGTP pyrophosphatase MutT (NUDIX family)